MAEKLLSDIPQRTAELVESKPRPRLFQRDNRTFGASVLLMFVFSICGLALGMLGNSDRQVAVYTMLGAAVGLAFSCLARRLMK